MSIKADRDQLAERMDQATTSIRPMAIVVPDSPPGFRYRIAGVVVVEEHNGRETGQMAIRVDGEWA